VGTRRTAKQAAGTNQHADMKGPIKVAAGAAIAAGIALAFYFRERLAADALTAWVSQYGVFAPMVFAVARIVGSLVLVPGSIMAIAAGAAFGFVPGSVYNLVSSTLGALAAFSVARFIAPDWIHARLQGRATLERIVSGVEAEGWRFVAFVRLVPLFPYNLVNYALGLTRVSMLEYGLATLVCMIPGDLAYVYMGYAAREALAGNERAWQLGVIALAALATLAFIPRLVRRLRGNRPEGTS
jgi:uncharacterized membrane protein YdjX (TVP38/TMEM64 family)